MNESESLKKSYARQQISLAPNTCIAYSKWGSNVRVLVTRTLEQTGPRDVTSTTQPLNTKAA